MQQTLYGSFDALGNGPAMLIREGESLSWALTDPDTFDAVVQLQFTAEGVNSGKWTALQTLDAAASGSIEKSRRGHYRFACTTYTSGTPTFAISTVADILQRWQNKDGENVMTIREDGVEFMMGGEQVNVNGSQLNLLDTTTLATLLGAMPAVSGLSLSVTRLGSFYQLDFTLAAVAVPFTDAAGAGSFGALKLFDFVEGAFHPLASRQNLHFTGDDLIDGDVGDLVFIHSLGSVTADAGDKALTSTEADIAAVSGDVTLSTYEADSSVIKGAGTPIDGMTTAKDIWFNLSGSAATAEANGVMTVDGTITVLVAALGDDG